MTSARALEFTRRIERVDARLRVHAEGEPPRGLTEPDPPSGEQWEAGQVWAHLAEFVPYWIGEADKVIAGARDTDAPTPFGRVKGDPDRRAAIERDRARPITDLYEKLRLDLFMLRGFMEALHEPDWEARGVHSTLGEMTIEGLVEEFLVGHLEEHADQLDRLAETSA